MHREVFLLKGIHPKKTGSLLGYLTKSNFAKIDHIKRVKNISKEKNLVIIDKIPLSHQELFLSDFELKSEIIVQIKEICKMEFIAKINSLKEVDVSFDKLASIFRDLEKEESIHVLLVTRFHKSMVRN